MKILAWTFRYHFNEFVWPGLQNFFCNGRRAYLAKCCNV